MARWMQSEVKFEIRDDYVLSRCGFEGLKFVSFGLL